MVNFWNKYNKQLIIGALIIALLLVSTCSHNSQVKAEGEKKVLTEQLNELKDSIVKTENDRVAEKDSLDKVNSEKQVIIDSLAKNDANNKQKIADLQSKLNKKRDEIAKYTANQIAQTINDRYKTNTTTSTDSTITATTDSGQKIIIELYEKDECAEENKIKDEQLKDKDNIISNVIEQRDNEHIKSISAEQSIDMFKDYAKKSDDLRKVDDKIIKKLKVNSTLKTIFIISAFVGGVLIGNQIAK